MAIRRRRFLGLAGAGLAGALAPRTLLGQSSPTEDAARPTMAASGSRIDELATLLLEAPDDDAIEVAAQAVGRGASRRELAAAIAVAGAREIRPRHTGGKLHAVLMLPSAWTVSQGVAADQQMVPLLYNVAELKRSQGRDAADGDWSLPSPPSPLSENVDPLATLEAAVLAWDWPGADRALASCSEAQSDSAIFERLWAVGARDHRYIGHKMIYTAQAHRALALMTARERMTILRSLVYGILSDGDGRPTRTFAANRARATELARELASRQLGQIVDAAASAALLAALRPLPAEASAELIANWAVEHSLPTLWNGLALWAAELLTRKVSVLSVHTVTSLDGFNHAFAASRDPATRFLMLLQAASWLAMFRDELIERTGLSMAGPGIEIGADGGIEAIVTTATSAPGASQDRLLSRAHNSHHYKLAAAASDLLPALHPSVRRPVLAACRGYLPTDADPVTEIYRRSRRALG